MAFLEARGIRKSYVAGTTVLTVLRDLDLTVDAGEMVAIVGASGVGKSTLLQSSAGWKGDEGRIATPGGVTGAADSEIVSFRNRRVGFAFSSTNCGRVSALEHAEMPRGSRGRRRRACLVPRHCWVASASASV